MDALPRLSRALLSSPGFVPGHDVDVPTAAMLRLPEKVVQFGTGGFLRGFADYFIDDANRAGVFNGTIVAVSSTASSRNDVLTEQDGLFTLAIRGIERNAARQRYRVVGSVSRALSAADQWDAVLAVARNPEIELVVSNTTEVGIVFDEDDRYDAVPPRSFPGKLTRFLAERAQAFDYDAARGVIVLPCELIEQNGTRLGEIVRQLAALWQLDSRFAQWLDAGVVFCNTLVDRIVPGSPAAADRARIEARLGYHDGLLTVCEPFASFVIEGDEALAKRLTFTHLLAGSEIIIAPDVTPYRERKVRVLNGAHTVSAPAALLAGFEVVNDAVRDERVGGFIRRAVFEEIVPVLEMRHVHDVSGFARDVIERFSNPYIRHALFDITLYQTTKMRVRVVPTILDYYKKAHRVPAALALGFAAYIAFMRGELQMERREAGLPVPADAEGDAVHDAWRTVDGDSSTELMDLARTVCSHEALWGTNLAALPEFADAVGEHLVRIVRQGIHAALDAHITASATT